MRIGPEPFDSPDAAALRAELERETRERYGFETEPGPLPTVADVEVFLVARDEAGVALGCGALRRLDGETLELKRMYVRPAARRGGTGTALLRALEAAAARLGVSRLRLETGTEQPEAMAFYERHGYAPIPCFGPYADVRWSRCYERVL